MSNLTPAQFLFLVRRESFITFGLGNVFYGVFGGSLIYSRLMHVISPGVYATTAAFLVYFVCECLIYAHNHSMPISIRDE
jgi:hypothetical protein